ncbi:MAG: alpha/beta hydrolase [Anaerolineae bacterium]|nr:alpha/beta hydrolase [Anaerolineae bacterium]
MSTVTSKDGTAIGYEKLGAGAPVILVDGAFCYRQFGPMGALAPLLSPHFTVYMYDRRGRGASGDTLPYALEREIEDIDALINVAGGSACVYGISSGAALALEATIQLGSKIKKLAMYEAPYNAEPGAREQWATYRHGLDEALSAGRPGDAVAHFMALVGTPPDQLEGMRQMPMWPMLEAVAPTLAYDATALGDDRTAPLAQAANVHVPTLVMSGDAGFPFMAATARAISEAMPNAQFRSLPGQTHDVAAEVIAPVLVEFFS